MKIESARDYFDFVVLHNLNEYKSKPDFLPVAFNLSNSLFNMCEWMWHTYGRRLGIDICKRNDYVGYAVKSCPNFGYIRDLANASKHVTLNTPSTQMISASDAVSVGSGFGEGGFGIGKFSRGSVFIGAGGAKVDFENAADEVFEFWLRELMRFEE